MLSALGLALSAVGAGALSAGLFRPSQRLYPGWARDPLQTAADFGFGITGFLFLAGGFAMQALPSFGVQATKCVGTIELVTSAGLLGGALMAWIICEVLRVYFFRWEKADAAHSGEAFEASLQFQPGLERSGRWRVPRLWQLRVDERD